MAERADNSLRIDGTSQIPSQTVQQHLLTDKRKANGEGSTIVEQTNQKVGPCPSRTIYVIRALVQLAEGEVKDKILRQAAQCIRDELYNGFTII